MPPPEGTVDAGRLNQVQQWMQACVMEPGPVEEAIASAAVSRHVPAADARRMVRPSAALTALERLDIYRRMYELRLIEALRVDYPGLHRFLGEDVFDELARMYVRQSPSRSYTLNRLGDALPQFLAQVEGLPRPRFVLDLARLELAETQVFDEEESPVADGSAVNGILPERWESIRLRPIAALRLIELDYPAHLYLAAMRADGEASPEAPGRKRARLVVFRQNFHIHHLELEPMAHPLLTHLLAGVPLGKAITAEPAAKYLSPNRVFTWFREWFEAGLFQAVE